MNAFFMVCMVLCIAAGVAAVWAHRNDNLTALENLDEAEVTAAVDAWNAGDRV